MLRHITSRLNPLIKHVLTLHAAKGRKQEGQCIVEGLRACTTAIQYGWKPEYVFLSPAANDQHGHLFEESKILLVEPHIMEKISTTTTPSGILCVFPIPTTPSYALLSPGIVLHTISDPGNMGTLIRTAATVGAKTVVIIEGADVWSPKVIQASAGMLACVNIFCITWQELLKHKKNLTLSTLTPSNGKNPSELSAQTLLVVGNEAHGIPVLHLRDADQQITLPMPGKTESLNAAIAGSIALYELFVKHKKNI